MAALIVFSGLAFAPTTATEYLLVQRLAPAGTETEALGWVLTSHVVGSGLGSLVAGAAVSGGGFRIGLGIAVAGATAGWAIARAGRSHLRVAAVTP